MFDITFIQLRDEVRRLANENPDYVYQPFIGGFGPRCFYNPTVRDGVEHEACIFGRALANLGVDMGRVEEGRGIQGVLVDLDIARIHTKESVWAGEVQYGQDRRMPWGDAVAKADRDYPL